MLSAEFTQVIEGRQLFMYNKKYTVGRTEIYACGDNVSRQSSSESVVLLSLKQEAPTSIGGSTFTKAG